MRVMFLAAVLVGGFGAGAAEFPEPVDTEKATTRPMSAQEAVATLKLPEGFRATVFAAEPDVRQPIAMTTDARGRLWVAENYTFSERSTGWSEKLRDRILIFEDANNDGVFDKRTVFWDGAQQLTSIEIGIGGVYALTLPKMVFIPDRDGNDVPDGEPQTVLDGFEYQRGHHTVANGLRWGPDGWLYGRHGIQSVSSIGVPGAPDERRIKMNVGIWRYSPINHAVEIVAQGTTNPWGMDWDAQGEMFFINTVIGHLWHVTPGAHFRRMYGDDANPHVYELIDQHADHVHWAQGEDWTDVRKGVTDTTSAAGGGHAHSGLMIYQGGQWPKGWNGKILMINLHGRRLNVDEPKRKGSGFSATHSPDAFFWKDPWFRAVELIPAPDGGVFVADWSDTGECHENDGVHRSSGRIYKLSYAGKGNSSSRRDSSTYDLTKLDERELAELQTSENDWMARQARRVLIERAGRGVKMTRAHNDLFKMADKGRNEIHRLRAMWTLKLTGADVKQLIRRKLEADSESERAWALRLLEEDLHLASFAAKEQSPRVRLTLASMLQRMPLPARVGVAEALLKQSEDADDQNIPLMIWWGIEPLATKHPLFTRMIAEAQIPRVQRLAARRIAEEIETNPKLMNSLLQLTGDLGGREGKEAVLVGLADGLAGRRKVEKPAAWDVVQAKYKAAASDETLDRLIELNALFGDGVALETIRKVALDGKADLPKRRAALQSLIEARADSLREVAEKLLSVRDLSATAAQGLALIDDPKVADRLLAEWPRLYGHERPAVMSALLSRPAWAGKLLDAIEAGKIRRTDLTAFHARQIRGYNDAALTKRLGQVWGEVQEVDESQRAAVLASWKKEKLSPERLANADLRKGHEIYKLACGTCHKLFGEGTELGPDLTGSGRDNIDYLLDNILFPSAIVPVDYRQTTLTLKDGRTLSGVIKSRGTKTITLQTVGQTETVDLQDVQNEAISQQSLMPEGLLDSLEDKQVRDLIAYLQLKSPLPKD